jgi:hypothetical protein
VPLLHTTRQSVCLCLELLISVYCNIDESFTNAGTLVTDFHLHLEWQLCVENVQSVCVEGRKVEGAASVL